MQADSTGKAPTPALLPLCARVGPATPETPGRPRPVCQALDSGTSGTEQGIRWASVGHLPRATCSRPGDQTLYEGWGQGPQHLADAEKMEPETGTEREGEGLRWGMGKGQAGALGGGGVTAGRTWVSEAGSSGTSSAQAVRRRVAKGARAGPRAAGLRQGRGREQKFLQSPPGPAAWPGPGCALLGVCAHGCLLG